MTPTFSRGFPASVRGDPVFACRFDSPHPDDGDHGPPAERTDPHRLHGRPGKSDHRGSRAAHRDEPENHDYRFAEDDGRRFRSPDRAGPLPPEASHGGDRRNGARDRQPLEKDKLQQALLNFVKNAMESISGEGTTFEILLPTERHEDKGAISNRAWRGIRNATPKAYLRQE